MNTITVGELEPGSTFTHEGRDYWEVLPDDFPKSYSCPETARIVRSTVRASSQCHTDKGCVLALNEVDYRESPGTRGWVVSRPDPAIIERPSFGIAPLREWDQ